MRWRLVAIVLGSVTLRADFLEVRRSVTLKEKPVRTAQTVTQLQPPTFVELLSETQENGYYHARLPATGEEGWVYRTFVRRHRGEIPSTR
jgi:hypothetical protein